MMRQRMIIGSLLLIGWWSAAAPFSRAQSASEDFSAVSFNGGVLNMDTRIGANLFGSGISGGSFSGIHSALIPVDGGVIFGNPASLTLVGKAQIGFETRFPMRNGSLGLGPTSILATGSIQRTTDRFLQDLEFPAESVPSYTQSDYAVLGQPRQLSAFWLTWPLKQTVGIGFGYRQPLRITSEFSLSGASTLLHGKQSSGAQSVPIDFLAELALNAGLDIQLDEISIGTGGLLEIYGFGSVWWGATVYRNSASAGMSMDMLPQGVMTISGSNQYYFNDSGDPKLNDSGGESNAFFWSMRGGYQGSGIGARLGLVHRTFLEKLGTSLVLNVAPRINLFDGDAYARSFIPVFLNMHGVLASENEFEDDLFDVDAVQLSRPNLTRQTHDRLGQQIQIHLPTSLTVGLDLPLGRHIAVVNISRFFGSLSIEGEFGLESGLAQRFKIGKDPSWGFKAGLDIARRVRPNGFASWSLPLRLLTLDFDGLLFELMQDWTGYAEPRYRLSGGLQWGQPVVIGLDNTFSQDLEDVLGGLIPTSLSVGRAYTLFDRLEVGVHVMGVPDLLMRFSLGFNVY